MITRRQFLIGCGGVAAVGAIGVAGIEFGPRSLRARLGLLPSPYIPDAPEGRVRLESVHSEAMGGDIDLFTAVPAGYGDGAGLPVVIVLHGASSTASDFQSFGFGRFLTAAVRRGDAPFVLAGTDDGPAGWVADGSGPDPQAMVRHELPQWLAARGFDADRRALWGWSRGGYGILRPAESTPHWARAGAVFSPAVTEGDAVFADVQRLAGFPPGLWCGYSDPYVDALRQLVPKLPARPQILEYADGGHTYAFWNDHTLEAFRWLATMLETL